MSNVIQYISYFRQLAVANQALKHNAASEAEDGDIGSVHFTKISVEEVVTGLRTKVGYPCLMLELYDNMTKAEVAYDIKQEPKGAFQIVGHAAQLADEAGCFDQAEEIVYDILKQMWQDHYGPGVNRCTTPFKDIDFGSITITPIGPVYDKDFGYRVEFSFELRNSINIAVAPAPGKFIF